MVPEETRRLIESEFQRGVRLFNAGQFFECHEVLEEVWRPARGEERLFLQAVIHLAVGFYHHQRSNQTGAKRQLLKGLKKLAGYLPQYRGIDTDRLWREANDVLATISGGRQVAVFPVLWKAIPNVSYEGSE